MLENIDTACDWYNLSNKNKKIFLILLIQSQTKLELNVCGVVTLNYSTFGKV